MLAEQKRGSHVAGRETIEGPRVFSIADEPPFKIRMVRYHTGRAVFSVWDLLEVDR